MVNASESSSAQGAFNVGLVVFVIFLLVGFVFNLYTRMDTIVIGSLERIFKNVTDTMNELMGNSDDHTEMAALEGAVAKLSKLGEHVTVCGGVVWCGVWCVVVWWCGGVVWCGVVWCGVVWCGVVWCGVVWCGVVWCGVVWCGVVWCRVVWCGVVSCRVVWCRVVCGVELDMNNMNVHI
jgi:hypothetical protein